MSLFFVIFMFQYVNYNSNYENNILSPCNVTNFPRTLMLFCFNKDYLKKYPKTPNALMAMYFES